MFKYESKNNVQQHIKNKPINYGGVDLFLLDLFELDTYTGRKVSTKLSIGELVVLHLT